MEKIVNDNDLLKFTLLNPEKAGRRILQLDWGGVTLENTGILKIEPNTPTSIDLVLSAGIHGNETAPLELINRLLSEVLEGQLQCAVRLLVIFGNPPAANMSERFTKINLNRLFSGAWKKEQGWEADRAEIIEASITDFFAAGGSNQRLHYDLHTAIRGSKYSKFAVHPFVGEKAYQQEQFSFLAASGIEAVLLSHQSTTTLSYYSYQVHDAHAFTLELGQVAGFGENDLTKLTAIEHVFRTLIGTSRSVVSDLKTLKAFRVVDVLTKDAEDYILNIADDLENFAGFPKGACLASSSKSNYIIQEAGDALVFPNIKLPVGQRSGLVVREVGLESLKLEK